MKILPLAGTVGTLALLVHLGYGDASMLVLGGALCLRQARRPEGSLVATLIRVPVVVLAVSGLGLIFVHSTLAADLVYLAVFLAARLAWRFGPALETVGRAMLLPLVSLFLAPQVELSRHPTSGVVHVLVATVVATAWSSLVPRLWKPGPPSIAPLAAAARAPRGWAALGWAPRGWAPRGWAPRGWAPGVRAAGIGASGAGAPGVGTPGAWAARRRVQRVRAAALELDAQLPPGATEARLAVLAVERAVETGTDPGEALAHAKGVLAALPPATDAEPSEVAEQAEAVDPTEAVTASESVEQADAAEQAAARKKRSSAVRAQVRTRLALQSTAAVALAFLAGQQLFGHHWPWTVITVLTTSLRATSRGEVAITAVERLIGALAGTAVATLAGTLIRPAPVPGTLLILALLAAGMVLRQRNYAWWAAAMTASLSLLYGLLGEPAGLGLLGERLLAILVGGACAVLPFAVLAPIRTRTAVRRRLGATLRLVGAALRDGPTIQNVRAADRSLDELRLRSRPLRLTARVRPTEEAGWASTLLAGAPALHAAVLDPARGTRATLAATVRTVAADLRS